MNQKKHLTNWFTTSTYRCINLALVTDIQLAKRDDRIIGAYVYQTGSRASGIPTIYLDADDATRLFNLLES